MDCDKPSLVLGASGFLGSTLCSTLRAAGEPVRGFDMAPPQGRRQEGLDGVDWVIGNFAEIDCMRKALRGCDKVYHLISTTIPATSNRDPYADCASNVLETLKLLELAREEGIRKIVFASSGGTVYGIPEQVPIPESAPTNPICAYGISKLAIEKYLHLYNLLYGIDYNVLRVSNVYGERQSLDSALGAVSVFIGKALRDEVIEVWGNGEVVRDYIHADDVIDALRQAMAYQGTMRLCNIGNGCGTSLNDLLGLMEEVLGRPVNRRYTKARPVDVPINVLDVSRAKQYLGWKPKVTMRMGLQRLIDSYVD